MNLGLQSGRRTLKATTPAVHTSSGSSDPRFVFLTTQAACDRLGYTGRWRLRSLYRFIEANGIPKYYRSPRRFLVRLSDLLAVLKRGGVSHASQRGATAVSGATSAEEIPCS